MAETTAILTASYRGDIERCRLLCESIDRRVSGFTCHYILVEPADIALFAQFAGPKRRIVDERELLPRWLRAFPDPFTAGRRRIWLSPKGPPLRGWHVQQLRRIAAAATLPEDGFLSCDSDVVFIRPFDTGEMWSQGRLRFYRAPGALTADKPQQQAWSRKAGVLLGIEAPEISTTDYIATVIGWRADSVRAMLRRIEAVTGRSWIAALAATRRLSECLAYGRFVEEVEDRPDRHLPTSEHLCHIYWTGEALGAGKLEALRGEVAPHQVAVGIQSFTGTDPALIRRFAGLA